MIASSEKLSVMRLLLHSFIYTLTQQKYTERERERGGGACACRHCGRVPVSPILKHTLRPSSPANCLSLTHTAARERPLICSLHQRREKVTHLCSALMQLFILPLLLILGVRRGFGTPLTSTEAPSVSPDPCEGRPCLNGGVCSRVGEMEESPSTQMQSDFWAYTCICSQGFTGHNCEVRV